MRRLLAFDDRVEIGAGLQAGLGVGEIAGRIDRHSSVVFREIECNGTKTRE